MTEQNEIERKPIFKREQIIKLSRLIHMRYKPAELARIIDVNVDTVYRSYLPAGAPHERDSRNNIWIVGTAFREWAFSYVGFAKRKKYTLSEDQAWCMRCNKPAKIINPKKRTTNRYISLIQGACEFCGGKVNRATGQAGVNASKKIKASQKKPPSPQEPPGAKKTDHAI